MILIILLRFFFFSSMVFLISVEAGAAHGGGPELFRAETVESASRWSRPNTFNGSGMGNFGLKHHGVVVHTKEGNDWLIHHPGPDKITTVTSAKHMSNKWTKEHDIPVKGEKTVQHIYNGAGGRTKIPLVNYATAGACKGAADGAESTLLE